MNLVALIIAGNSIEVLDGCIEHHRNLGVDAFVVLHIYSEDDTPKRLRELADEHEDIHLIFADPESALHGTPFREAEEYTRKTLDPDWMIQIDCDERWFVRDGLLKDVLSRARDEALTVRRYNVVWPTPAEAVEAHVSAGSLSLDDLPIAAFPVDPLPSKADPLRGVPWVLSRDAPKSCLRVQDRAIFSLGGHFVLDRQTSVRVTHRVEPDLLIAQLAFSTLERFERKVRFARWCLPRCAHLPKTAGWHWKRLVRISDEGPEALRAEWARQFLSPEQARNLVGREVIIRGSDVFAATCRPAAPARSGWLRSGFAKIKKGAKIGLQRLRRLKYV